MASTAAALLTELRHVADPSAYPNRHYRGGAAILGVRMGTLFDIAKRHSAMPLVEVGTLLDRAEYEPRLAAFCVLDFQVRRPPPLRPRATGALPALPRPPRRDRHLGHVDRVAPRVVGGFLRQRSWRPLFDLAESPDPLRWRTAMTAPLAYVRPAQQEGIVDLLRLAEVLAADPDPVVSKPVGIALKHSGAAVQDQARAFLDRMGDRLAAPTRWQAQAKLR